MSKKICCEEEMTLVAAWDDPYKTNHAFNLYFCSSCGMLKKEDVWENAGVLEIDVYNKIEKLPRVKPDLSKLYPPPPSNELLREGDTESRVKNEESLR